MDVMTMKILILGSGGHGKVALDTCLEAGWLPVGFLDDTRTCEEIMGYPVLGKIDDFTKYKEQVDGFFVAIGDNHFRLRLLEQLDLEALEVPTLIHPFSSVSKSVAIGFGSIIVAGAVINAQSRLGKGVIVNTNASIDHDCSLGDGCHVSPGARLAGSVSIGTRSWVGIGASIIENITIGSDSTVGAGAVVIEDVPDRVTVVGVPARPISYRKASE